MKAQNCSRNRLAKRIIVLNNLLHSISVNPHAAYPSGYSREAEVAILKERIAHPGPVFTKKSRVDRVKLV